MRKFLHTVLFLLFASCTALPAIAERRAEVTLTTSEGKIVLVLYNETPIHRDNFIKQVKQHTYDGVLFHRVISNFMIQAGDPLSKTAVPGQLLGEGTDKPSEWLTPEFRVPDIIHRRGVLAAAREGDDVNPEKKSSCQQFYIVTRETTPWLDGSYTVFGEVKEGMPAVERIEGVETDHNDRPLEDVRIFKARVTKKYRK